MLATGIENLSLNDPRVLMGMFIGGSIPFLVSSITMTAVGDAAFEMIEEIRRQFREIPGLLEGKAQPDTAKCVDIATNAALKKMLLPGAIAIGSPVAVGFILGPVHLGGMLAGALLGCVLMALMMANAGGAWDNAKKFVEKGNFGGKGTEAHAATVVGDTVGDPFKDTSGPSMNILINVMAITLIKIFIDGPEVSLNGSPTVSPTTVAACASVPLPPKLPFSTNFLALSHAPPALAIIRAISTHPSSAPASMPPK